MTGPAHDRAQLGAYAIGALDPVEARMVHEHLGTCLECQREVNELMMIRRALDQVPPEAFLDGPPEDGDLLLRRTLRRVATEAGPAPRRRMTGVYVAAAAAVVVALGGGIVLGRESASTTQAGPTFTVATSPTNAIIAEGENARTGAAMDVAMEPKKGWVWVDATATGLPEGKPCALYVISNQGEKVLAGTWLVSAEGAKKSRVNGMALIAPDDVKSVVIETMDDHKEVVAVPI